MTDVNNTTVPSSLPAGGAAGVPLVGGQGRSSNRDSDPDSDDRSPWIADGRTVADVGQDPLARVSADVEEFARIWIRRIRRVIQRSSKLVERESLLVAAIKRLDDQKAEWRNRTAAKESSMKNQSQKLAEAWLEVESERRKLIQENHVKAATAGVNLPPVGIATSAPAPQPSAPQPPAPTPATPNATSAETANQSNNATLTSGPQLSNHVPQQSPLQQSRIGKTSFTHPAGSLSGQMMQSPVQSGPVGPAQPNGSGMTGLEALKRAEAATREKIAEFKRMQRAIRSSRNK